jgi:hypothetical protein
MFSNPIESAIGDDTTLKSTCTGVPGMAKVATIHGETGNNESSPGTFTYSCPQKLIAMDIKEGEGGD